MYQYDDTVTKEMVVVARGVVVGLSWVSAYVVRSVGMERRLLRTLGGAVVALLAAQQGAAWASLDGPSGGSVDSEGVLVHVLDSRSGRSMYRFLHMHVLAGLPQHTIRTRTPWADGPQEFTGPRLADVVSLASSGAPYGTLRVTALNDYVTTIPATDLQQYGVVLAMRIDGQRIPVRRKGPLFVMYPFDAKPELRDSRFYARAIWQVHRIDVR